MSETKSLRALTPETLATLVEQINSAIADDEPLREIGRLLLLGHDHARAWAADRKCLEAAERALVEEKRNSRYRALARRMERGDISRSEFDEKVAALARE